MLLPLLFCLQLLLLQLPFSHQQDATPVARFPLQFSANLTITSNQLSPELEYPPRTRRLQLHYDYPAQRARADIAEGYEAAKMYIRRYDLKKEYMVRHAPIGDCKRSLLTERMSFPILPAALGFVKFDRVEGRKCSYFLQDEEQQRVHAYFDAATGAPVRLIQEDTAEGQSTPMLTYDFADVVLAEGLFSLPAREAAAVGSGGGGGGSEAVWDDASCDRHVAGFPYLHVWHYYVKF